MKEPTTIKIMNLIWHNPGIHLRELSRKLDLGIPSIKYALDVLKKDKIIIPKLEGRNLKFYIDYNSQFATSYISQLNVHNIQGLPNNIRLMVYDLLKFFKIKPLITIVFGSYAIGDYNKDSDLDLLLIYANEDKIHAEEVEQKSKIISQRYGIDISPVYLSWMEFKEKFHDDRDKFIKQVKSNKIIFFGIEWWVMLENESS